MDPTPPSRIKPAPQLAPAPGARAGGRHAPRQAGPSPKELGRRIRMMRVARGLTLKELEARGSISATHVSEIERGKASPTVGARGRIAHALEMCPATLLEPITLPEVSITRAGEEAQRRLRWGGATLEALAGPVEPSLIGAHLMELAAGREPALTHHHEGEEWITVLAGLAEVRVLGAGHLLHAGDSLHLRAHHEHTYANPGTEPAVLLVVCRPRLAL
ncbi:MAG: helix-turn-helix transcriptional regulator [Candidatus Eisenbacteria bacterium]|uniref:Helix-turn-helix transcriptional regulator n=1 Tax=Eiseniibacteriota bacterium TaxID=2212470 RepID=A0A9D6QJH1_UNCEI|nr:helix-turn-helix transcriptional regulator [Candidatus Eisenbacteria bacterium]